MHMLWRKEHTRLNSSTRQRLKTAKSARSGLFSTIHGILKKNLVPPGGKLLLRTRLRRLLLGHGPRQEVLRGHLRQTTADVAA